MNALLVVFAERRCSKICALSLGSELRGHRDSFDKNQLAFILRA